MGAPNYLLVLELNQPRLIRHDLVPFILALLEKLGEREPIRNLNTSHYCAKTILPLPRHLVTVIRIYKLIVVHAVRVVSLHLFDCRLARVEVNDIVYQTLAVRRQLDGLRWVRMPTDV